MSTCATEASIEVSIGLEDPLVITSDCAGLGIQWYQLVLPEWSVRSTYAPPSAFVPGIVLLQAVEEAADLVVSVNVQGSSANDLEVQKALLKAALSVYPNEVTVTMIEGGGDTVIGGPWAAFPSIPRWGEVKALLSGEYFQDGVFSVTVNPIGAP